MRRTLVLVLLLSVATVASGATINVRRDGTGDFASIQQALDAAADGDTILIGPGEYTETTTIHPPGWPGDLEVYGEIRQQNLTIIGAGAEATIIGPPVYAPNYGSQSPEGLACDGPKESLVVSDLTVRNCYMGMSFNCRLTMYRCHVDNNYYGVHWTAIGSGGAIKDSRFTNLDPPNPLGLYVRGVAGVLVEDCEFERAHPYVDNAGAVFRNCSSIGPLLGLYSASGTCELWNCRMVAGIGVQTGYIGARVEIHDSEVQGTYCSLLVDYRTSALVEDSSLAGGSNSVIFARNSDALAVHGCDFVRGAGPVLNSTRLAALGAVTYDLRNNFWGTTSEIDIQSWIIDSNDDPNIHATVLYSPFAGQSVPTETKSWGDLKAFWR